MKMGLVAGAAIGYYIGAKAGRQRYEQLNKLLRSASRSSVFRSGVGKSKALVNLGIERSHDLLGASKRPKSLLTDPISGRLGSANKEANRRRKSQSDNVVFLADTLKQSQAERRYL